MNVCQWSQGSKKLLGHSINFCWTLLHILEIAGSKNVAVYTNLHLAGLLCNNFIDTTNISWNQNKRLIDIKDVFACIGYLIMGKIFTFYLA